MGAVYEVEHARTGERLALKVLLAGVGSSYEAIERFKREARASARIKSEHVVRVTDADVAPELEGAPFLVMELLDGMDLEQAAAVVPPPPETVVTWLRQVAQAIDKAHRLGIIHRDLKPENLFLATVDGRRSIVKVLDFGIAKMIEDGTGVTGSGQMLGTPRYMSPEQASPSAPVTPATDRCALGLIAYRLLMGESYYQGGALGILAQILHGDLQPPSERAARYGAAFDAWFLKACHREPARRFPSASEQIEALAEALGLPSTASEVTLASAANNPAARATAATTDPTPDPRRSSSRRPVAIAISVAVGLTVVSLSGWMLTRRRGPSETGETANTSTPSAPPALPVSPPAVPVSPPSPLPAPSPPPVPPPASDPSVDGSRLAKLPGRSIDRPRSSPRRAGDAALAAGSVTPGGSAPPVDAAKTELADPYAEQK